MPASGQVATRNPESAISKAGLAPPNQHRRTLPPLPSLVTPTVVKS